ncbi:MAG: glycosyltransferase family 1 protein [Chlamydiae bacterium]|nr:glycosyltransferase family 1 protein [Chlamydiota bacterium]
MRILHTESSSNWGGQEIRILKEAEGLRDRGHEISFAVAPLAILGQKARQKGFAVYEVPMKKSQALLALVQLRRILKDKEIDIVNTHSHSDAWLGGLAARIFGAKLIRTRHLSTKIRSGLNSRLLYKSLADFVVTTSSCVIDMIANQSKMSRSQIKCIPTGLDLSSFKVDENETARFKKMVVKEGEILVGTVCFVRSWKGIVDLLKAAKIVKASNPKVKWVIIGGGYYKEYLKYLEELDVKDVVTFTGHLESPYSAMAALDVFLLLSTAHEGISQAAIQAAYLGKPQITTDVGGLPELCLHGETGFIVPKFSPEKVAQAVLDLAHNPELREEMGHKGHQLVKENFLLSKTLDQMESVYQYLCGPIR